ncbi:cation:proton antiporter, partial [Marinobacter nauticus]
MSTFAEYAISAMLIIGGVFTLIGAIGLARLPDFYTRLHGP